MQKFLAILLLLISLTGCAVSTQITTTSRSSVEERLLVDQGNSFVGAPAFTVPVLGFVMPEIALFKNARHSGHAAVEVFTIDSDTDKFVDKTPPAIGETDYNDYTLLIVIHFSRSNMETDHWDWQPGS